MFEKCYDFVLNDILKCITFKVGVIQQTILFSIVCCSLYHYCKQHCCLKSV